MDALQSAFYLFGGLVFVLLIGYTYWQYRRNATMHASHRNMLRSRLEGVDVVEPTLVDHQHGEAGVPLERVAASPAMERSVYPAQRAASLTVRIQRHAIDDVIDLLTPIAVPEPVAGHTALAVMPEVTRIGTKAFAIEGWNESRHRWEGLQDDQRYARLRAGLQFVDRSGCLSRAELVEYEQIVRRCANAIHGVAERISEDAVLARAQELHQFVQAHDGRLFFQLRAVHGAWGVNFVQEVAREMGFVPGAVLGQWVLPSPTTNSPVLGLQFDVLEAWADTELAAELNQFELGWEVALVPRSEKPFDRLCEVSAAMAAKLGAAETDESGVTLSAAAKEEIAQEIEALYDAMEKRGIPAGSDRARRICS